MPRRVFIIRSPEGDEDLKNPSKAADRIAEFEGMPQPGKGKGKGKSKGKGGLVSILARTRPGDKVVFPGGTEVEVEAIEDSEPENGDTEETEVETVEPQPPAVSENGSSFLPEPPVEATGTPAPETGIEAEPKG